MLIVVTTKDGVSRLFLLGFLFLSKCFSKFIFFRVGYLTRVTAAGALQRILPNPTPFTVRQNLQFCRLLFWKIFFFSASDICSANIQSKG